MNKFNLCLFAFLAILPSAFATNGQSTESGNGAGNGGDFSSLQSGAIGNLAELMGPMNELTQYGGLGVGHILSRLVDGAPDELVETAIFKFMGTQDPSEQDPTETKALKIALKSLTFKKSTYVEKVKTGFKLPFWQVLSGSSERLALAYQEFDTHTVYEKSKCDDKGECTYGYGIEDIGSLGRSFLRIHEAYIRLEKDRGLDEISAETYARVKIARLVSKPEFEKILIKTVRSSNEFTSYSAKDNLFRLWLDLGVSKNVSDSKQLQLFLDILAKTGFECSSTSDTERRFLVSSAETNKKLFRATNMFETRIVLDKDYPEIFGSLCSLDDQALQTSPNAPSPGSFLDLTKLDGIDEQKPSLIIPGPDFEHLHPSVGGNLHILVTTPGDRCSGIPFEAQVKDPKNTNTTLIFSGKTNQDFSIPVGAIVPAPGSLFLIQIRVPACKFDPTTYSIYAGGDHNGYAVLATPSSLDSVGAWGILIFRNEGD